MRRRAGATMRRESSSGWGLEDIWQPGPERTAQERVVPEQTGREPAGHERAGHGPAGRTARRRDAAEPRRGGASAAPDPRVSLRTLRPGRTPAGILTALLISVAGWAATAELIRLMLGGRPQWSALHRLGEMGARTWGDPLAGAIGCLMILSGVVLVAHALMPGRPRLVPLETRDPLLAVGLTRSGLRRTVAAAARSVDGVAGVHVSLHGRRVEVAVRATTRRTGDLMPRVGAAVGDALARLGADHDRHVVLRLYPGR